MTGPNQSRLRLQVVTSSRNRTIRTIRTPETSPTEAGEVYRGDEAEATTTMMTQPIGVLWRMPTLIRIKDSIREGELKVVGEDPSTTTELGETGSRVGEVTTRTGRSHPTNSRTGKL